MTATLNCQYKFVAQEADSEVCPAPSKVQVSRGFSPFVCFDCTTAGAERPSSPKVGPIQQPEILPISPISHKDEECATNQENRGDGPGLYPISIMKKVSLDPVIGDDKNLHETLVGAEQNTGQIEKKVQWADACQRELVEIREFEPSDGSFSEDEFECGDEDLCACVIM